MPVAILKEFLDRNDVSYETIPHRRAYTTQEVAAATHIPGREMVKTVMVRLDGELAMVVLPAPDQVDLDRVRDVAGAGSVELAEEGEFRERFPSCEPGAMPPFGNLWDMRVFADRRLRDDERIAFNAGTHDEVMRLAYDDFERLVGPVVTEVSTRRS